MDSDEAATTNERLGFLDFGIEGNLPLIGCPTTTAPETSFSNGCESMTETSNSSSAAAKPIRQQGQSRAPFFWGAVACLIFYGALPFMPVQQDFLLRYCCSHPLEYVTIGLFFIGMSTLAFRGFDLSRETSALEDGNDLLLRCKKSGQQQLKRMEFLKKGLLAGSSRLGQSLTGRRIEEAVNYLEEVGDSEHCLLPSS